jgi:outer membrane protein assembly factor BamB
MDRPLTSDGTRVYSVEDLAVPPPYFQNFNQWGGQPPPQNRYGKDIDDAVACSKLVARDLYTGLIKWQLGGRADAKEDKTNPNAEVKESYFLGPPLSLGGKLYVMTDKNQELRMVCINAAKGEVEWSQPLANTREKMDHDVNRRVQAAQLAYGDGVLVCPTNSGAILGVDLLSHSLLWAYPYREKDPNPNPNPGGPFGGGLGRPGMGPTGNPLATDWKVTPPVIVDGKVVFTAPDAQSLHCIDLRKGSFLWKETKAEADLFLGGVFDGKVLVVSKDKVRAISLKDGPQKGKVWEVATGLPSGLGVASDDIYYLPLKGTAQDKGQPEICSIDIKAGKVKAHTKSRKNPVTRQFEIPGNLVMFEGDVLSQGLNEVMAFPQLEYQKKMARELLAKNPSDPIGLTKEGELFLDEGKLLDAVTDLRKAIAQTTIDQETTKLARLKLYESLTELMQAEFPKAEDYLAEYEELCKNPNGSATDIPAEKERRLINYYCLLAKGREGQEKYTDAFQAYMDFIALTANKKDELVNTTDESSVRSAPDVWASGRIAAMMADAKGASRKPFEDKIASRWKEASEKGDLASLRQFVAMFGSQFAVGREARLQLAERLMEESGTSSLLDAERHLIMLQGQQDDRTMAARAVETFARLLKRKGMLAEAAYQYRMLSREFPAVVIRDGKTGADYFNDLAADKFLLPYLDGPRYVMAGKLQVKADMGQYPLNQQVFNFECDSDTSPYFDQHRLAYNINFQKFQLLDQQTGEERWGPRLNNVVYFQNFLWNNGMTDKKRFAYQRIGHLVVLNMGNMIFGLDPINKQVLWEKNLLGAQGQPPNSNLYLDPNDDSIQIMYPNNFREAIGHIGPAEASYVALLTRDGMTAIDPLSGRTLWTRAGISPRSHLFGDTQHVYVIEIDANNQAGKAYVLRASDGVKLEKAPDFGALYAKRIQILGRTLLLSETDASKKMTLRLYDIPTGRDAWKQEFPAGSVPIKSDERDVAGAVEPSGKVTLVDLRSQKTTFEATVEKRFMKDVNDVRLFQDSRNYYVALNTPIDPTVNPGGMSYTNIQPTTGMRCTPINGEFYCFDRETKKMIWHNDVPMNRLLVNHFQDMPMVLFTSRNNRAAPKGGGWGGQDVSVTSIDKTTGKRLYDKTDLPQDYQQFYDMKVDLKNGKIELIGWNFKITHTIVSPEGAAGDGKKETGTTPSSGGGYGSGGGPTPVPLPIKRGLKE